MSQNKLFVFVFLLFGCTLFTTAQTAEERLKITNTYDKEEIKSLNEYLKEYGKTNSQRLKRLKAVNNWPDTIQTKDGSTAYLIGVNEWDSPLYVSTMNEEAAQMQGARALQTGGSFGVNIEGQGMIVGVWDGGKIRETHQSYVGRTIVGEFLSTISGHATHVAGTIASNGAGDASARGIAPQSSIEYYAFRQTQTDVQDEVEMSFAASNGLLVSNHSYGVPADAVPVAALGKYDGNAQSWDQLANTYPYYLIVSSAGNSRNDGVNLIDGGYDLLTSRSNAKNILVVGASAGVTNYTGPSSVTMSNFSSWGPTDDGRVKPDITTKGVAMYSTGGSTDTEYIFRSGTSMSAPAVSGGAILLQQYHNSLYSNYLKAASLKGLILHTADEAGRFDGPDYAYGWGLLSTSKAATAINNLGDATLIDELTLSQGSSYTQSITATGNPLFNNKLIISLSWSDPASQTFPSAAEDDRLSMLINDLDLTVTSSTGVVYRPWKLDPNNPNLPATTGINDVDNFEKIEIDQLTGDFTITVNHKGGNLLPRGSQDFTLIVTGVNPGSLSNESANTLGAFKLYPNPTNDQFTVSLSAEQTGKEISIDVYDILGKQIISNTYENTGNFEQSIDVSQFNSGIYLVRVGNGTSFNTRKLIIK